MSIRRQAAEILRRFRAESDARTEAMRQHIRAMDLRRELERAGLGES